MTKGVNAHVGGECAACGEPNANPSWFADGLEERSGEGGAKWSGEGHTNAMGSGAEVLLWGSKI